jgi:hypothetical protein
MLTLLVSIGIVHLIADSCARVGETAAATAGTTVSAINVTAASTRSGPPTAYGRRFIWEALWHPNIERVKGEASSAWLSLASRGTGGQGWVESPKSRPPERPLMGSGPAPWVFAYGPALGASDGYC